MNTERSRARVAALLAGIVALAVAVGCGGDDDGAPEQTPRGAVPQGDPPNVVVVITDDQTVAALNHRTMPFTTRYFREHGTTFTDAVVTTPLCCPARAGFLTGQYTHNHGAWSSFPGLKRPDEHLASWLRAGGYQTAMVGKYLNNYDAAVDPETQPAQGWDQWRMLLEPLSYYGYDVSVNGKRKELGSRDRDYQTSYLNRETVDLVERWSGGRRPFFVWYAPHAPHDEKRRSRGSCAGKAVPAPGDLRRFGAAPLPRPPSFNEADTQDKPPFMRQLARLGPAEIAELEYLYRCRHASLLEVDRGVRDIVGALRDGGELDNTILVFTSDNGLFYGEHRLTGGKRLPYAESVAVPLVARFPVNVVGGQPVAKVSKPVANIDLAPTVLELIGAEPCIDADTCRVMDGRSLTGLIIGDEKGWPADRARLLEMRNCRYSGLLADDQLVVRHFSVPPRPAKRGGCRNREEWELYDLAADPYQLESLAQGGGEVPDDLLRTLRRLRKCAGIEGRDPAPSDGRSYCG